MGDGSRAMDPSRFAPTVPDNVLFRSPIGQCSQSSIANSTTIVAVSDIPTSHSISTVPAPSVSSTFTNVVSKGVEMFSDAVSGKRPRPDGL